MPQLICLVIDVHVVACNVPLYQNVNQTNYICSRQTEAQDNREDCPYTELIISVRFD